MTLQNQHSISSTNYKLIINSHGAELAGLYWKDLDHNWIWSGDSWKRHAPILFPIVGRLKNDRYTVNGSSYELSQHGFARDMEFSVTEASANAITFKLTSSTKTFEKYPFHFDLFVRYEVSNDDIAVTFKVHSKEEIYFSFGWHPAFVFPDQKSLMGDLRVAWEKPQTSYHLLSKEGLIAPEALMMPSPLNIEPSTFQKDALIFKEGLGDTVIMDSQKAKMQISMHTGGASQFGIWSKNAEEFVCLEPWWGCADLEDAQGDLKMKFGIQKTGPSQEWSRTVRISLAQW